MSNIKKPSCERFLFSVTIFDELFRSENVKQVYAIVIDWLATLDDKERKRIK